MEELSSGKYDALSRIVMQNIGGKSNINTVTHCITRLRFSLKDESKANTDVLNSTEGIVTVYYSRLLTQDFILCSVCGMV